MEVIELSRFGHLMLTRSQSRQIAQALPPHGPWVLGFRGIDAATSSFLDEIMRVAAERRIPTVKFVDAAPATVAKARKLSELEREPSARRALLET